MRPKVVVAGILFALAAGSWASVQSGPQPEHVYSLATVSAGFVRHPAEWAGRTVLVRATVLDIQELWRSFNLKVGQTDNPRRVLLTAPLGPQNLGTTTLADVTIYAGAVSHGHMLSVLTR